MRHVARKIDAKLVLAIFKHVEERRTTPVVGGTAVAGLWNVFGAWADVADAVSRRHPEAWVVSCVRGAGLDAALTAGFSAIGPLRVWTRESLDRA